MNCLSWDSPPSRRLCKDQYEETPLHSKDKNQHEQVKKEIYFSISITPATLTSVFLKFPFQNSIKELAKTAYLQIFIHSQVIIPYSSALHNMTTKHMLNNLKINQSVI